MPYRDKEQQREAVRQAVRRQREALKAKVIEVAPALARDGLSAAWAHLADYIQEPCPGMPRLERMRRIAGSLGRYADQVYFGAGTDTALSLAEVGEVIGTLPPLVTR